MLRKHEKSFKCYIIKCVFDSKTTVVYFKTADIIDTESAQYCGA